MKTTTLDLLLVGPSKKEYPRPPSAHIYLKTFQRGKRGMIYLTAECMSIRELDGEIQHIKRELSAIRAKAKVGFEKAERRLHDRLSTL